MSWKKHIFTTYFSREELPQLQIDRRKLRLAGKYRDGAEISVKKTDFVAIFGKNATYARVSFKCLPGDVLFDPTLYALKTADLAPIV